MPQPAQTTSQILCPYCGHTQDSGRQCDRCRGLFEPLSRQATQNSMGPWQIRDENNPFTPGCSIETVRALIARGRVRPDTIVRGPTTHQFWRRADDTPGLAHLLGRCHACGASARSSDKICPQCAESFLAPDDRQNLGLSPVRSLTGPRSESPLSPVTEWRPATPAPAIAAPSPAIHSPPLLTLPFSELAPPQPRKSRGSPVLPIVAASLLTLAALAAAVWALKPFASDNTDPAPSVASGPAAPEPSPIAPAQDPAAAAETAPVAGEAEAPWRTVVEDAARLAASGREADIRQALERVETAVGDFPEGGAPLELAAERERLSRRLEQATLKRFLW